MTALPSFTAADIRDGDVIRVFPGTAAVRVYGDPDGDTGPDRVFVVTADARWTLPAGLPVELVARHGRGRPVSLVKAWYLGPVFVGSVVAYRHGPRVPGQPAPTYTVTRIEHDGFGALHWLAPYGSDVEVFGDVPIGDLVLIH
ncbi:hypothetical protein [Actinomadura yumaensis]|uniref:Uncharacterized protein n=1 Tax=Actinomadura yumaensis TaxID=111807 RepID=A0ABW2CS01_9ACTN